MYYNISFMQDVKIFNDHELVADFSGMTIFFKTFSIYTVLNKFLSMSNQKFELETPLILIQNQLVLQSSIEYYIKSSFLET